MAKKTATKKEFSVEDKLRALHQLQIIDSEIDNLRTVRGGLPLGGSRFRRCYTRFTNKGK